MTPAQSSEHSVQRIVVSDIRMSFGSMVVFMVKWAIASIPAAIILAILVGLFWAMFTAFAGSLG